MFSSLVFGLLLCFFQVRDFLWHPAVLATAGTLFVRDVSVFVLDDLACHVFR